MTPNSPSVSRQVESRDIKFFAMDECPPSPPFRDDLPPGHNDEDSPDAMIEEEENHTHVYFYVTSFGEVDPELTEKFPLFPTDLVISEELTYLVPRVRATATPFSPPPPDLRTHTHTSPSPKMNTVISL